MMSKLIVIVGITGNQGGSVAQRFLDDSDYRIRGLTRNPSSVAAQKLITQGVDVVAANLHDVSSLILAFSGANLIFSVTNFWEPFFQREKASEVGKAPGQYAYDVEFQQGKNIADAAATTVKTLDRCGFVVSTLSHARKRSGGRLKTLYHFDAKADVFPHYVNERHPELAQKMSCLQTGFFTRSWKMPGVDFFHKNDDGSHDMRFPTHPSKPVPHLDVNADTGNFVYAISKLSPGKSYMASGTDCSWTEYMRLWSEVTGISGSYKQITVEEMAKRNPDYAFGIELADMFDYSSEPGYDGGDRNLLRADDIRKLGVELQTTSLQDWLRREDWSPLSS